MTNPDRPHDESQQDVVPHDPSPRTSPGTGETTTDILAVREFTPYFVNRGLTLIEAVGLWDELEAADITAGEGAPPVIRVHRGVTYELTFEWSYIGGEAVVAVTARNRDIR